VSRLAQMSLAKTVASATAVAARARDEREQRGVAAEPAVVRVDQAAVPLVGEPGDRDAGGQVRVDDTMRKDTAAQGIHSPHPGRARGPRTGLGSRKKMAVVMLTIENAMANEP